MDDFVPCEICGNRAVDVHHIENRGMGGDPTAGKDVIENLMGLCRGCHNDYGDLEEHMEFLKMRHSEYLDFHK
jgi:5-methylcytosine-specific restriction endonuclease McrA